jgi:hypothetical protein
MNEGLTPMILSKSGFKSLRHRMVLEFLETAETPSVFFADRISKGILALATHFAERGSLIYFEPCGTGDEKLFRQMCGLCHILKYSQQRARTFVDVLKGSEPLLQVETLGDDGIRFRCTLPTAARRPNCKCGFPACSFHEDTGPEM